MNRQNCPFCSIDPERIAFSSAHGAGIWDGFPVSPGHLLIVVRRHASTWDELTDVEKAWAWSAIDQAIAAIRSRHSPEGFNVGFNLGSAAGQTISHFHLHVIPRYSGDVDDPRGGVRHVIPTKANYLTSGVAKHGDQQRLIKGDEDPFLPHLIAHMDEADTCDIAVAFLLDSGARRIFAHLKDFLDRGGKARILVGDYLDVTEPIEEIARRVSVLATRVHRIAEDFSVDLSSVDRVKRLLIENPIKAFVGARGMDQVPYFKFDGATFAFAFDIPDPGAFGALLREVLDWRLAQYLSRGQFASDVVCRVSRNTSGNPILFLPSDNASTLPEGPLDIELDGRPMEAIVAKTEVNVVRAQGAFGNDLPTILHRWFGDDAGLPGRSDRVRFRKDNSTIVLEPFGANAKAETGLKLWERYSRAAIPAA